MLWATDCADHVLAYCEEQYPEDDRPRKAIAARVRSEMPMSEVCAAAFAARDADHAAAHAADHGRWTDGVDRPVPRSTGAVCRRLVEARRAGLLPELEAMGAVVRWG